nr:site-specific integrase [uncultured Psychroserpens sp.]
MSSFSLFLRSVHDRVHDYPMKLTYSEPKIYTGGVDVTQWSKLNRAEQKIALSKSWYVYYSYRHPQTNKLVRQKNIKGGANTFNTRKERLIILKQLKKALMFVLDRGYNPYDKSLDLKSEIKNILESGQDFTFGTNIKPKNSPKVEGVDLEVKTTIKEAFEKAMLLKKQTLKSNSYSRYKSRINQFRKWLNNIGIKESQDISIITKKTVIDFLNGVLIKTSPRNRNNSRADITSLFQVMYDNDIIEANFVKQINVLKSNPERNKTYKPDKLDEILSYLKEHDKTLLLFIEFISYGLLRPIEICRLTVGDIDINDAKMYIKAKNKPIKIKLIPDILIKELPDLSDKKDSLSLFTPEGFANVWSISDDNKRDYFTKRFKKVKDKFELGKDYGLYSFRHTYVTKLYRSLREGKTPFEAKSTLMQITGHSTMDALDKYLRDIDAELPEDFSQYF